jgi:dTDP-glucose 4,6-dehydratase
MAVLLEGRPGEIYNIGGDGEMENIAVVELILETLGKPHELISYVADRPGHDRRYAIDSTKIQTELGWKPLHMPRDGIRETVKWYLENRQWWEPLLPKPAGV